MTDKTAFVPAVSRMQIDNPQVRVTEWRIPPGGATGFHRHEMDYVITPIIGGVLTIVGPDGVAGPAEMIAGESYFRAVGVEHDVQNAGSTEIVFIETELKA
jgi:quercetin dioxygenase-like cupin family protein